MSAPVHLAVVGAHLTGMPLNHELTQRSAMLVRRCRTRGDYRLYALAGIVPPKPGLVRDPGYSGSGIELEVWALGTEAFGDFVNHVPPPLVIGTLLLEDGGAVKGFLCEPCAIAGSVEITGFGGWRAFVEQRSR